MTVEYCDDSENVLHAVLEADWDRGRMSLGLLEGKNKSVSRLSVYSQDEIFAIFHRDLDLPSRSPVVAALEWNVKEITDVSRQFFKDTKQKKDPLKVRIDIQCTNAAHAEIDGKVTGGLSKQLVRKGRRRREPRWVRFVYWCLGPFKARHRLGAILAPPNTDN